MVSERTTKLIAHHNRELMQEKRMLRETIAVRDIEIKLQRAQIKTLQLRLLKLTRPPTQADGECMFHRLQAG